MNKNKERKSKDWLIFILYKLFEIKKKNVNRKEIKRKKFKAGCSLRAIWECVSVNDCVWGKKCVGVVVCVYVSVMSCWPSKAVRRALENMRFEGCKQVFTLRTWQHTSALKTWNALQPTSESAPCNFPITPAIALAWTQHGSCWQGRVCPNCPNLHFSLLYLICIFTTSV